VKKIIHRAATLLFTVDKYAESLHYLQQVIKYSEEKKLPVSLQVLCEVATLHWELNDEKEALAVQAQMKGFPLAALMTNTPPMTRSKYLCTMECSLLGGAYSLTMRINREQPHRKEGEPLEDTEAMKRKLDTCFLEVIFEATDKSGKSVTITSTVDKPHHFEIHSPQMGQGDPGKWYEVTIYIYRDERHTQQTERLGVHHQLVFATPNIGRGDLGNF